MSAGNLFISNKWTKSAYVSLASKDFLASVPISLELKSCQLHRKPCLKKYHSGKTLNIPVSFLPLYIYLNEQQHTKFELLK